MQNQQNQEPQRGMNQQQMEAQRKATEEKLRQQAENQIIQAERQREEKQRQQAENQRIQAERQRQREEDAYLEKHPMAKTDKPQMPVIPCIGGNQAVIACCNPSCRQNAFICYEKDCDCQQPHKRCKYMNLEVLVDTLVDDKMQIAKDDVLSFASIFDIIDKMIKQLNAIKDQLYNAKQDFGLKKFEGEMFNKVYKKQFKEISGIVISNVDQQIRNGQKPTIISASNIKTMWEVYDINFKRICVELRTCFDRQGTAKIKANQKSRITQEFMQLEKWIQPSFGTPIKQFKLLFRASQHDFSANQFHQKCDGIPNTLVLVKTEFDKVIGGFTNKPWNQSGNQQKNQDNKTFIFSLTTGQKMTSINANYSIFGTSDYGPTFGGGRDLYICDKALQCDKSVFNFPHSFNLQGKNYINNQFSYAVFSGQTNGYNAKIKEYEVYQIL